MGFFGKKKPEKSENKYSTPRTKYNGMHPTKKELQVFYVENNEAHFADGVYPLSQVTDITCF